MIFRVRIYADHAIVGKDLLIKPLSKLGAKLLEMQQEAAVEPVKKEPKAKKTRKKRTKKVVAPVAEVGEAPADLI